MSQQKLASISPVDGTLVGEVDVTSVEQISSLVEKSREAQKLWAKKSLSERANLLKPVAGLLRENIEELSKLMSKEMGKPVKSSAGEISACAGMIEREVDEMVEALSPVEKDHENLSETVFFQPLGVSVAITPWNFPMLMPVWQLLPSLMAGNSVLFKPSEETPLIAQALADLMNQLLPEGVLIVVHGKGEQGAALVDAEPVRLISFTGSRATGGHILKAASGSLKRVILELGGKDPLIVLKDADLAAAAQFAIGNGFRNSGQVCVSTERVYAHKDVFEEFNKLLETHLKSFKVGDSLDEETDMGPMVNVRQKKIVEQQIADAKSKGAQAVVSGVNPGGNYVLPTVLTNVNHEMSVMKDETFGPVLGVMPFETVDEAVELANDSPYGLGAAVFGGEKEAEDIAMRLDSGMVGVNKGVSGVPASPWVGAKESGYGFHSSEMGHRQFAQVRVVTRKK